MDLRSEGDVLQVTTADPRNLAATDYESLKTLDVMGVCWALSTDDVIIYIEISCYCSNIVSCRG